MNEITANLRLIFEKIIKIRPSQSLLILSDTYSRSRSISNAAADLASSMGLRTIMAMFDRGEHVGVEPPPAIGAAMKTVDFILDVNESVHLGHTNARKEATAAGVKFYGIVVDVAEEYLRRPILLEDLEKVKNRTEKIAQMLTTATTAKVTTPYGTDLTMSLEGREAISLHPLGQRMTALPDYAEAAISPVEGSSEGVVVVDASVRGWGIPPYLLRKPIRFEVSGGKIKPETISSDIPEQAERLRKAILIDDNASNCPAELGIGTSHVVPETLRGDFSRDYALAGTLHIAFGRNDDIGGKTHSNIHADFLMTDGTIMLDDVCVLDNGVLMPL